MWSVIAGYALTCGLGHIKFVRSDFDPHSIVVTASGHLLAAVQWPSYHQPSIIPGEVNTYRRRVTVYDADGPISNQTDSTLPNASHNPVPFPLPPPVPEPQPVRPQSEISLASLFGTRDVLSTASSQVAKMKLTSNSAGGAESSPAAAAAAAAASGDVTFQTRMPPRLNDDGEPESPVAGRESPVADPGADGLDDASPGLISLDPYTGMVELFPACFATRDWNESRYHSFQSPSGLSLDAKHSCVYVSDAVFKGIVQVPINPIAFIPRTRQAILTSIEKLAGQGIVAPVAVGCDALLSTELQAVAAAFSGSLMDTKSDVNTSLSATADRMLDTLAQADADLKESAHKMAAAISAGEVTAPPEPASDDPPRLTAVLNAMYVSPFGYCLIRSPLTALPLTALPHTALCGAELRSIRRFEVWSRHQSV